MTSLIDTMPPRPALPQRLHRFLRDLRLAAFYSALTGVLITLVEGNPQILSSQMIYSTCIGSIAAVIVDGARLALWDDPSRRRHMWPPFIAIIVLAAPVAHYCGIVLGALLQGDTPPSLANYPNPRQISMILFSMLCIAAFSLVIVSRERLERIKLERGEALLRAEAVERQALQAQLRLLQAQIEPHMLFNTLANLQGLIAIDPQQASRMLDQLIQYLRATLSVSRMETTTLDHEFAALEAYLGLMAVRMGARLSYRCSLPEALRGARLPTMLLQPLVENAIVHGLEPKIDGGMVRIEAAQHDDKLEITVCDTGLGLTGAGAREGGGVGLSTTRERLQVLYGERAGIDLQPSPPQGTLARLTLPLEFA
ncbi:Sensor histidine kinase YpdA [Massilia sp. Bi118]|uniref:sensor histidine kinase n=1 Tax=Massilia sp. Bi118 TaxID=2822346 RepID=UPI001DB7FFD8|nr:histidine kinase [Massilia sp. Bi118]CAH0281855.1 Sensor histidine kinase YpdA [Massilia sp. Bi118]